MERWPPPGGFAERMLRRSTFSMSEIVKEIDRLELEHIDSIAVLVASQFVVRSKEPDCPYMRFAIATAILRIFMGKAWINENVFGRFANPPSENRKGGIFDLSEPLDNQEAAFRREERVLALSEYLYNLQDVPGIKHRISLMKTNDLETALAELRCASLIASRALKLRFIIPVGVKGSDYDSEFTAPGGQIVCCEIKTNKQNTIFGKSTIGNTLEAARKQLPKGKPGIIFLTVPENWVKEVDSKAVTDAAISKVLRQSNRLIAIVVAWEEWMEWEDGRIVMYKYLPTYNTRSSQYFSDIKQVLDLSSPITNSEWLGFYDYVSKRLPDFIAYARLHFPTEGADPDLLRE